MSRTRSAPNNNNNNDDDYYAVLGISPNADSKAVRQAYLKLSLQHHPDKNPDDPVAAQAAFVRIGQAYQVLSDPTQRAVYDATRRRPGRPTHYGTTNSSSNSSTSGGSHSFASGYTPHTGYYYSNSSNGNAAPPSYSAADNGSSSFYEQQQQYETYREAFDATMASLSEDELRDVAGAAAMFGGIVGSIMGSRLFQQQHPVLREVGSVVGSLLASQAANAMVQTAHTQSVQRAALDQDRRERIARGEPPPPDRDAAAGYGHRGPSSASSPSHHQSPNHSNNNLWHDLVDAASGPLQQGAKEMGMALKQVAVDLMSASSNTNNNNQRTKPFTRPA